MAGIDLDSPTWQTIRRFIDEERKVAVNSLSATGTPMDLTENLRGRLAMLEKLERLPTEALQWSGERGIVVGPHGQRTMVEGEGGD